MCRSHPDLVIGHSMGGKVAMEYVRVRADLEQAAQATPKPQNVWILDSQPGTVGPDLMPDVTRVLQAVQVRYHSPTEHLFPHAHAAHGAHKMGMPYCGTKDITGQQDLDVLCDAVDESACLRQSQGAGRVAAAGLQ